MRRLIGALNFYVRFAPSFTAPALKIRSRQWQATSRVDGQTWLVTGASGGIGKAICQQALDLGATVIAVARRQDALDALHRSLSGSPNLITLCHDLSLMGDIRSLVEHLSSRQQQLDVLINNVGVLLHEPTLTDEQQETSFATNLLGHYALTNWARRANLLKSGARVINMSSGGMYNVPLLIEHLNTLQPFDGTLAYALHKRAQVILNDHWQETDPERLYFVTHPGWVDTRGVETSLPTFHKVLQNVLRSPDEGADTAVWLAATAPDQTEPGIWFDRKLRDAHIYKMTRTLSSTGAQLDSFLASRLENLSDTQHARPQAVAAT